MKILIVDDEQKLADTLARGLTLKGHTTEVLYDGKSALTRISLHSKDYDLIILDLMLPFVTGTEICKTVRELDVTTPILILSAQGEVESKVDLLLSGADDYMVKPFSFEELSARVQVLLRRPTTTGHERVMVGDIELNITLRTAVRAGTSLSLTLKEFALLEYLLRKPNEVVNREELLSHLWDFNYDSFSNVVDVHVKNLRKKLGEGDRPSILEAVRGVGYRLRI